MEETTETANTFGRFSPSIIYDYIKDGVYPDSFSKVDKGSLRKRAKFFTVKDEELYYQNSRHVQAVMKSFIHSFIHSFIYLGCNCICTGH